MSSANQTPANGGGTSPPSQGVSTEAKVQLLSALLGATASIVGGFFTGRPPAPQPSSPKGSVDYYTAKFQKSRWFGPFLFLSLVTIGLGQLVDSVSTIINLLKTVLASVAGIVA